MGSLDAGYASLLALKGCWYLAVVAIVGAGCGKRVMELGEEVSGRIEKVVCFLNVVVTFGFLMTMCDKFETYQSVWFDYMSD